jgi:hypothetical protein
MMFPPRFCFVCGSERAWRLLALPPPRLHSLTRPHVAHNVAESMWAVFHKGLSHRFVCLDSVSFRVCVCVRACVRCKCVRERPRAWWALRQTRTATAPQLNRRNCPLRVDVQMPVS